MVKKIASRIVLTLLLTSVLTLTLSIESAKAEIPTTINIDPDTLNLKSNGKWITVYIELPEENDVSDIDISTVMLNDEVPAELHPTEIGDYDEDGIPDLMVKFDRQGVMEVLSVGEATLTITGKVGGMLFEGTDTIRVIEPMPSSSAIPLVH